MAKAVETTALRPPNPSSKSRRSLPLYPTDASNVAGVLTGETESSTIPGAGLTEQVDSGIADLVLTGQIPDADTARTENLLNRLEQQQLVPVKSIESAASTSTTPAPTAQKPGAQVKDPNAQQAAAPAPHSTAAQKPQTAGAQKPVASIEPTKPVAAAEPQKPQINFDDPVNQGYAPSIYMGVIENAVPVYHFVSTTTKRHFCTISEDEKYKLLDTQPTAWKYQGIAFFAYPEGQQPEGARPVYRFWSDSLKQHFYTMDEATKDMMIKEMSNVWKFECIAWYGPGPQDPGTEQAGAVTTQKK